MASLPTLYFITSSWLVKFLEIPFTDTFCHSLGLPPSTQLFLHFPLYCHMIEESVLRTMEFYHFTVDLQCCVNFRCLAKSISYTYICSFLDSFSHTVEFYLYLFIYFGLWNFKAGRIQKVYLIQCFSNLILSRLVSTSINKVQWRWHWFLRLGHKAQAALVLMECWLSRWSLLKGSRHALGSPRHLKRPQVRDPFEAWGEPRVHSPDTRHKWWRLLPPAVWATSSCSSLPS